MKAMMNKYAWLWPLGLLVTFFSLAILFTTINNARSASPSPLPPNTQLPSAQSYRSMSPAAKVVGPSGLYDACVPPTGTYCTTILDKLDVSSWPNVTISVKTVASVKQIITCGSDDAGKTDVGCTSAYDAQYSGGTDTVFIEGSPNGTDWEVVYAFDAGVGLNQIRSANYMGNYAFLRIEGSSAAGATCQVFITALRP